MGTMRMGCEPCGEDRTGAAMNQLDVSLQHTIATLAAKEWSARKFARELGLDRETVRRYLRLQRESKPAILSTGFCGQSDSKPAIVPAGSKVVEPVNALRWRR